MEAKSELVRIVKGSADKEMSRRMRVKGNKYSFKNSGSDLWHLICVTLVQNNWRNIFNKYFSFWLGIGKWCLNTCIFLNWTGDQPKSTRPLLSFIEK